MKKPIAIFSTSAAAVIWLALPVFAHAAKQPVAAQATGQETAVQCVPTKALNPSSSAHALVAQRPMPAVQAPNARLALAAQEHASAQAREKPPGKAHYGPFHRKHTHRPAHNEIDLASWEDWSL